MGSPYYQFCPIAKAMELLDERWTMLLMRELVLGSEHFNELRRGLPRMSPSLLSRRLEQLQRAGLVERLVDGSQVRYVVTQAGRELRPVLEGLSAWGIRWVGELGDPDLDPTLLLWDMHRNVEHQVLPPGRTVVRFGFADAPGRHWWLVLTPEEADLCDADPGHEVDVSVDGELRALTEVWRGDRTWAGVLRSGALTVRGPERLRRALPGWFAIQGYARVPRPPTPPAVLTPEAGQ